MRIHLASSLLAFSVLGVMSVMTPALADSAIEEMRSTEAPSTAPALDRSSSDAVQSHRGHAEREGRRFIRH